MYQYTKHIALPLLTIVVLGAFLRFYQIGGNGLWIDEAFSIWMGRQPVGEILGWLVRIDQHPPLYYVLLHFWIRLGDGEAVVRALSALCSTLTIPVIYLLGRRLADRKAGLLAALILAVSPFHVHLAQEARMYSLLALNASLALLALARLLTDPRAATLGLGQQLVDFWRAWRATHHRPPLRTVETDLAWLAYVVFTAAALLTHNTAVFLPIAANLLVLGLFLAGRRPCSLRNWLLAQLVTLLLWSLWLPSFVSQSVGVYREFWIPAPDWMKVGEVALAFVSEFLPLPLVALYVAGGLYGALAVLGLVRFRRQPGRAAFLFALFVAPFVGELLVSLRRPIFYERTLIWATLPLYVLLAAGVCKLRRWPLALAGLLMIITTNGLSLHEYYVHFEKEEWDKAAAFVADRVEPGDLILFNATWIQIPFDYYFHQLNDDPVAEHGAPADLFDRGILEPKMAASDLPRLRALVRDRQRVWLVYSHNWYTDPQELIPPALEEEFDLQGRWEFYGLQVWLYEK
jgi:mannosyltransferase